MNAFTSLSSLSMDLRRVSMGYHRGSRVMAQRFFDEALKRKEEIDPGEVKPYIQILLERFPLLSQEKDPQKIAEDALMYSTLFQNAAMKLRK